MTNIKRFLPIVLTALVTVKVVNAVRRAQAKIVLDTFLDLVTQEVDDEGFTVGYVGEDGWPEEASDPESVWLALGSTPDDGFDWNAWAQSWDDVIYGGTAASEGFRIISPEDADPFFGQAFGR